MMFVSSKWNNFYMVSPGNIKPFLAIKQMTEEVFYSAPAV